jgi:peptide/nickel transport system substrate-binding protein
VRYTQTGWVGADALGPTVDLPLRTNGDGALFGWLSDDRIEALRARWIKGETLEERRMLAATIERRAFGVVPYIPTG